MKGYTINDMLDFAEGISGKKVSIMDLKKFDLVNSKLNIDPLKNTELFKYQFIEWLNKYFERVDKVFEYKSKNKGVYYTNKQLFKTYKKAMLESPFK